MCLEYQFNKQKEQINYKRWIMSNFLIAVSVIELVIGLGSLIFDAIQCSMAGQQKPNKKDTTHKTEASESYYPKDEPFSEFNDKDEFSSGNKTEE